MKAAAVDHFAAGGRAHFFHKAQAAGTAASGGLVGAFWHNFFRL